MKKRVLQVLCLLTIICASQLYGQESDYNNALKISPIQFGKSYLEIGYELGLNNGKTAIQISPMVMLKKSDFEEFKGFQTEVQYRTYLKRFEKEESMKLIFTDMDFFAGAYGLALTYDEDFTIFDYDIHGMEIRNEFNEDIFAAEAGVFVGVKIVFGQRVCLDMLAGGGVRYSEITTNSLSGAELPSYYSHENDDVFDLGYYGVKPKLKLQLGITL